MPTTEAQMVVEAIKGAAMIQVLAWATGLPVTDVVLAVTEIEEEVA